MIELRKILGLGDDVKLTKGERQLADLIEQQQARIAECERLHRELATSLRHGAESPSLCDLVAVARAVSNERDELAATVERLREACQLAFQTPLDEYYSKNINSILYQAINSTPANNLNAIKRDAWIKGYQSTGEIYHGENTEYMSIVRLAAQRYPDKE